MSEKATLYFVFKEARVLVHSSYRFFLSIGDSKVTLGPNGGDIEYKIKKEVTKSGKNSNYLPCIVRVNLLEDETTIGTGFIRINPEDFLNSTTIDIKEYRIMIPDSTSVSAYIGVSLIPHGGSEPTNYKDFVEKAKVISYEIGRAHV